MDVRSFPIGLALMAALVAGAGSAQAATFAGRDVSLVGSASVLENGDLQLTPAAGDLAGAAWDTTPLSTAASFSTTFTFSLAASDFDPMADGFAFVLQGAGTSALGSGGGTIGLDGLDAVALVVQTWDNNRVGLVTDANPFNAALVGYGIGSSRLITGTSTVSYDADAQVLSATGSLTFDTDLSDADPGTLVSFNESVSVDLAARFGAQMYAGFTAGTGLSYADQRITSWGAAAPVPEPETYALLVAGLGLLGLARHRRR
ncbi:MAG: L-type lectin-domain containing protein [Burkholderiales bacterium]